MKPSFSLAVALAFAALTGAAEPIYVASSLQPPAPQREFRAGWVATVANIDWPSRPGLPVAQQKAELIGILDRAADLRLNAIVLQVRPACDALYVSKLEPWSYYLTGAMGKPPQPFYDPLAFAVAEAHQRGLELHAWFNPYRALRLSTKSVVSPNHVSKLHPELVREYGEDLWLDPGERDVQDYSARVVMDVVKRYDIDGVHFDDYFYPYRVKEKGKTNLVEFPDEHSWKHFGAGGPMNREDWRRENVNTFVERLYQSIKAAKPWVKFGISPFGIWQPGFPAKVTGMNAYTDIYCDARKWLMNGWVDYCAPQLYWSIDAPGQSYPLLLKWWEEQNPLHRHIWPGIATGNVHPPQKPGDMAARPALAKERRWTPEEINNQIRLTRAQTDDAGNVHWSMKSLMQNQGGIATALKAGLYAEPALIPASPWLDTVAPGQPTLTIKGAGHVKWEATGPQTVWWWLVQSKSGGHWTTLVLPGSIHGQSFTGSPEVLAVTAIDRCGVAGMPAVVERSRAGE